MIDIYTRVVSGLPYRVKGFVLPCEDGYCIYINEAISDAEKEKTYWHEVEHIERGDLDDDCIVSEVEFANGY